MTFVKMLIGLPILLVLLVFSFVNNDLVTFNLWPFYIEVTISLSVVIVFLFIFGFLMGSFFSWLSYAPILRHHKKENKKLSKEHVKLVEKVSGLEENLQVLKGDEEDCKISKPSLKTRIKTFFKRDK